ncbi:MAG: hypothetical protein U0W24_12595 [Bacteroidales bacterium]
MQEQTRGTIIFSMLFFAGLSFGTDLPFFSSLCVTVFVFFSLRFFTGLGNSVEIRDLMIVIALLQWIVGPVLKYHSNVKDIFYYMAIPEAEYISYAGTASLVFIAGLYLPGLYRKIDTNLQIENVKDILKKNPNMDLILIGIGVLSGIIEKFSPESIKFFLFLVGGTRFIGMFFLVMNNRKFKWPIFGALLVWLFIETVKDAIFHELLLWLTFLFIFISFLYKFSTRQKILFIIPFFIFMGLVQSIKFYFRAEIAAYSGAFDRAAIFTEMVKEELSTGSKTMTNSNFDAAIDRINQGWIVARIMRYTPAYEPYANGETIITGIRASLIPRFLDPNKPKAGGRDNFERFTGKKLSENTSMGLSPLGEAYANFGVNGGILFMFLLGLFYNFYIFTIIRLSNRYHSLILWLPLLFLQVVKAETDFVVVLNHLVKASIVVAVVIFAIRRVTHIKI